MRAGRLDSPRATVLKERMLEELRTDFMKDFRKRENEREKEKLKQKRRKIFGDACHCVDRPSDRLWETQRTAAEERRVLG
jgi:hypothetical protein